MGLLNTKETIKSINILKIFSHTPVFTSLETFHYGVYPLVT